TAHCYQPTTTALFIMSLAADYDPPSMRDGNNPAPRSSQNKFQLLEATMRNVPKLKELNYTQWKNVITNSIKKAKLWGYVDGSIEEPSEHDASNLTTYFDEATAVRNAILGSLEYGAQKYIEEALDPKDAWLALEKKYLTAEGEADSQLVSVQKQLANLRFEDGGDMAEHIADFCRMRCQLNGSRFALDNQASVSMLYRSLPPNYRQLVLTSEGAEMKEFSALCARLSYISHNPELQACASGATSAPSEDYTNWGVPEEIRAFGLTGDKNPLLEKRAAITCRDCLLKDHEAGTPDCPQYEWRRELWGDSRRNTNQSGSTNEGTDTLEGNKRFIYEFSEPVKVVLQFGELKLKEHLVQSLGRFKLRVPQGIQQCAILPIIQGRNLIAQAPPETGKTTTIILSIIELTDTSKGEIQALILAPTEKKATDVYSMVNSFGYRCYTPTTNQSTRDNLAQLAKGHNFSTLVGTPDHILQLLRQGILVTSGVQILALDNLDISADNVLNPDILDIYQYLPRSVQTLSISSTTGSPNTIAKTFVPYVNKPLYITISRYDTVFGGITHAFLIISNDSSNNKPFIIDRLINAGTPRARAGVLCDTFSEVEAVQHRLNNHSSGCYYTSANLSSDEHQQTINNFRQYSSHLVTTMSVPLKRMLGAWEGDNFWVVNYNPPSSPQNYLERIRYLGLCSGKNMAITLVNDGTDEVNTIREIERHFNIQMAKLSWNGSIELTSGSYEVALEKKYVTAEAEADSNLVSIEKKLSELRLEEGGDMIEHIAEFCRERQFALSIFATKLPPIRSDPRRHPDEGLYYTYNPSKLAGHAGLDALSRRNYHQIVVGTSECLLRLIRRNIMKTHNIKVLALDDIDKIVKAGSEEQMFNVYQHVPPLAQIVASSISLSSCVTDTVAKLIGLVDPVRITVHHDEQMPTRASHYYLKVAADAKSTVLYALFRSFSVSKISVLCRDTDQIKPISWNSEFYYVEQSTTMGDRENIMLGFEQSYRNFSTLIITDATLPMGRVLNTDTHLINYDVPNNFRDYAKRLIEWKNANRNQSKIIITFVTPDTHDIQVLQEFERYYGVQIHYLISFRENYCGTGQGFVRLSGSRLNSRINFCKIETEAQDILSPRAEICGDCTWNQFIEANQKERVTTLGLHSLDKVHGTMYAAKLSRWAGRRATRKLVNQIRLVNILSGDAYSPLGLEEFEAYLALQEHSLENLQFIIWFHDYQQRFFALDAKEQALSPPLAQPSNIAPPTSTHYRGKASVPDSPSSPDRGLSPLSSSASSWSPWSPISILSPASLKDQPFRSETLQIVATFIRPGAKKELNLDMDVREELLRRLEKSTHPDVFAHAYAQIYELVDGSSVPNFVNNAAANINLPKQIYWYAIGAAFTLISWLIAIFTVCFIPDYPPSKRSIRLVSVPFAVLGCMQVSLSTRHGEAFVPNYLALPRDSFIHGNSSIRPMEVSRCKL
ncbi:unnamed protein product, partial [Rhizoctonia solani]